MSMTNCPNCGYDMDDEYEKACERGDTKWVQCSDATWFFDGEYSGLQWTVFCKCKKCKTEWAFDDSNV